MAAEDIYFDALVFPVGTGDKNYIGSGVETIEGIRLIKQALPEAKTVLGVSNVSFGLPPAGREVLNSVFLYHCVQAGLDMAIVNSEKLERYASIPEEERRLAEDLIWWRGDDPIAALRRALPRQDAQGDGRASAATCRSTSASARYILEGTKDGLYADLDEALRDRTAARDHQRPADGRDGRGRPAVRQQRDDRRRGAAVGRGDEGRRRPPRAAHGEGRAPRTKGRIVLATVKGDVHDIGKNLVDIILSNNGFKVINLGIKVPPEELRARRTRSTRPTRSACPDCW